MLPIAVPAVRGCKYGKIEANLNAKHLIFILAPEVVFESTNSLNDATSHKDTRRHGGLIAQEQRNQLRCLDDCVRRNAKLFYPITLSSVVLPAMPPLNGAIDHGNICVSL